MPDVDPNARARTLEQLEAVVDDGYRFASDPSKADALAYLKDTDPVFYALLRACFYIVKRGDDQSRLELLRAIQAMRDENRDESKVDLL